MTDCLHCEINDLVQRRMKEGETDLGELAAMMVESLADLILLARCPASATRGAIGTLVLSSRHVRFLPT